MGVLDAIGQFSQGLSQGAGQGMNLYEQYEGIQERGRARQQRARAEQQIKELVQTGLPQKDPLEFTKKAADVFLQNNDYENYDKWQQQAFKLRDFEGDRIAASILATGANNPEGAVELMNKFGQVMGTGVSYTYQRTPEGFRIGSNVGGKSGVRDYTDPAEFHHDVLSQIEGYVMKPEDRAKLGIEREKGASYIARNEALSEQGAQKLRQEQAVNQARINQLGASAQASLANASTAQAREAREAAMAPARQALLQAQTGAAQRQGLPQPADTLKLTEKLVSEYDPMSGQEVTGSMAQHDPAAMYDMQIGLKTAIPGLTNDASFQLANRIARLTPQDWGKTRIEGGMIKLPGGLNLPYTPDVQGLLQVVAQGFEPGTFEAMPSMLEEEPPDTAMAEETEE